jgi:hypothetical protein
MPLVEQTPGHVLAGVSVRAGNCDSHGWLAPLTGLQAADEEAGRLIDQAEREPPAEPSAHLYIVSVMMALRRNRRRDQWAQESGQQRMRPWSRHRLLELSGPSYRWHEISLSETMRNNLSGSFAMSNEVLEWVAMGAAHPNWWNGLR